MRIKDKQPVDRPREKLALKGAAALTDLELLQTMIGSGNKQASVDEIAQAALRLLKEHKANLTHEQLQQVTGLGAAKTTELLAAFELGRRYLLESDKPIIDSPEKAAAQLADIRDKKQEYFVCLTLDGANRLINKRMITIGTLTSSIVHPREVFAGAIEDRAASIIVAHNHPSGRLSPSDEDIFVTDALHDAGQLLGIELFAHVIITKDSFSLIEEG